MKYPVPDPNHLERIYQRLMTSQGPCIDTRKLKTGQVFFALAGTKTDGHNFLQDARNKGAAFAVVESNRNLPTDDSFFEVVPHALGTLQALAVRHRRELGAQVIGITGSNGKTTTKDLIYEALSTHFHTFATPGNLNNHIGLPLSILQVEKDVEFLILEMGDNQPGDIAELCSIAQPTIGLITNIGQDHLAGYGGSLEANAHSKLELFNYVQVNNGLIFRNRRDPFLADYSASRFVDYGTNETSLWPEVLEAQPGQLRIRLNTLIGSFEINSRLTGSYNVENITAAAAVALHAGIPVDDLTQSLENFIPRGQRSQLINFPKQKIIADCYNANPSSMQAALNSLLSGSENEKLGLVIGEMLELGNQSAELHRTLAPSIKLLQPHVVIGIGEGTLPLLKELTDMNCHYYSNASSATEDVYELLKGCTLVFVKGSRATQLETIVDALSK